MPDRPQTPDDKLQQEFNRWADAGEGEKMENHHLDITEKTIRLMDLRPGERVLTWLRIWMGNPPARTTGGRRTGRFWSSGRC